MAVKKEKKPEVGERYQADSYDELFPGRFLKAGLFKGKEVTLRIAEVYQELMPDKKGTIISSKGERCKKQTVFVVETPQGRRLEQEIAINKTNAVAVMLMFGTKVPGWVGRLVTFGPRIVDAFGEEKEAIRVVGSPELPADAERAARVGRSDKTYKLKKTPMPPNVRVVASVPQKPAEQPQIEREEATQPEEAEDEPFVIEKASAAGLEDEQPAPDEGAGEEELGPAADGNPL